MVKNCLNCAHRNEHFGVNYCLRGGYTCSTMRRIIDKNMCDENFSGWHEVPPKPPKPPRRGFLKFLYDTFIGF